MSDKRANNGGNSTRATRPDDKRLKTNKNVLDQYIKEYVDLDKIKKLLEAHYKLAVEGDTRSANIYLSYVIGKPIETKDIKLDISKNLPEWMSEGDEES